MKDKLGGGGEKRFRNEIECNVRTNLRSGLGKNGKKDKGKGKVVKEFNGEC